MLYKQLTDFHFLHGRVSAKKTLSTYIILNLFENNYNELEFITKWLLGSLGEERKRVYRSKGKNKSVFFFRVRQDRDTDRSLIGEKIWWLLGTEKLLSDLVGSLTKIFGASQGF